LTISLSSPLNGAILWCRGVEPARSIARNTNPIAKNGAVSSNQGVHWFQI
jgi:hypothetical protein